MTEFEEWFKEYLDANDDHPNYSMQDLIKAGYLAGQASARSVYDMAEIALLRKRVVELERERDEVQVKFEKLAKDGFDRQLRDQKELAALKAQAGEKEPVAYEYHGRFSFSHIHKDERRLFTHPTTEHRVPKEQVAVINESHYSFTTPLSPDTRRVMKMALEAIEVLSSAEWEAVAALRNALNAAPAKEMK